MSNCVTSYMYHNLYDRPNVALNFRMTHLSIHVMSADQSLQQAFALALLQAYVKLFIMLITQCMSIC